MGSPLQLLRDLLPFGQPPADRGNASPPPALPSADGLSPLEAVRQLSAKTLPAAIRPDDLRLRFSLLEDARHQAEEALPGLESLVSRAVLPLPPEAITAALEADNLLKRLALAYAGIARRIFARHQDAGLDQLFHHTVQRALAMVARRQLLACRAYASPSTTSWRLLHELYRLACDPHAKPLNSETAPIEHEYVAALLFAYLEPNKLPRAELDAIHACTWQLAAYAVVAEAMPTSNGRDADACFLVRPEDSNPGYPLARLPAGLSTQDALIIDCSQVLAAIDRNLARQPGKAVQPALEASPALLQSLRGVIARRGTRRFSRTRFKPRADLVGGLEQVIAFLDGHVCSRRSLDAVGRHDNHEITVSEWSLVDESPDGFLIRFIKGEKWIAAAGDIVALQPRESSKVHVCLVRRIATAKSRLEVGLQLLSPHASLISLPTPENPHQKAIFLPSLPAYGKFPGLIVRPGAVSANQKISFTALGRQLHQQIGQCIEAHDGLEFLALDPLPD